MKEPIALRAMIRIDFLCSPSRGSGNNMTTQVRDIRLNTLSQISSQPVFANIETVVRPVPTLQMQHPDICVCGYRYPVRITVAREESVKAPLTYNCKVQKQVFFYPCTCKTFLLDSHC